MMKKAEFESLMLDLTTSFGNVDPIRKKFLAWFDGQQAEIDRLKNRIKELEYENQRLIEDAAGIDL